MTSYLSGQYFFLFTKVLWASLPHPPLPYKLALSEKDNHHVQVDVSLGSSPQSLMTWLSLTFSASQSSQTHYPTWSLPLYITCSPCPSTGNSTGIPPVVCALILRCLTILVTMSYLRCPPNLPQIMPFASSPHLQPTSERRVLLLLFQQPPERFPPFFHAWHNLPSLLQYWVLNLSDAFWGISRHITQPF